MLIGRFSSLLFLLGLGIAAVHLPQIGKKFTHGPLLHSTKTEPSHARHLQDIYSLSNQKAPGANLDRMSAHKGILYTQDEIKQLDRESQQILSDINPQVDIIRNPIIDKILRASKTLDSKLKNRSLMNLQSAQTVNQKQNKDHRSRAGGWSLLDLLNHASLQKAAWRFPLIILGLAVLFLALGQKSWARLLAGFCHSVTRKWLFVFSLAVVGSFMFLSMNLWHILPGCLWQAPIVCVLFSAGLLRMMDMNAPVWNRTLLSLLSPLTACVLVSAIGFVK